ncbi:hypothetical protein F4677DRAFT_283037 [Hypoxylon crocopeplum]|nr:hypothetical protein F4677DRAFT_283037 [Hypoxylon crocopeplum]
MSIPDCSHQPSDPLGMHPEPDISGIGVLVGFISTAYILLFIIVIYYVFGYDPVTNPFGIEERYPPTRARPNPFDQLVLSIVRWVLCINALQWQALYKNGRLAAAFDKFVVNMADIQIVNGLAILIAGMALLPQSLSALHWKMIVYLAWFSCITNLSALTFLRRYLIHNPFERIWRLGSTFILLVALMVSLVPTGHFFWRTDNTADLEDAAPSAYAICYFNTDDFKGTSYIGKNSMLLSMLLLVFSYMVKMFKLYRPLSFCRLYSNSLPTILVEKCLKSAALLQGMIGSTSLPERVASNMIIAGHFVVFWLVVSLAWGTIKMNELEEVLEVAYSHQGNSNQDDSTWSFGQILPILLIAGPILILIRSTREAFVPNAHDTLQPSIAEPGHYSFNMQEAGVVCEHSREPQMSEQGTSTETNALNLEDKSDCWMLEPGLFTEYYKKSSWMCWTPAISLCYIIYMSVLLLAFEADPILRIVNFVFWFVLQHGALLQCYILLCSWINWRWKHPTIHIAMCFCLAAAILAVVKSNLSIRRVESEIGTSLGIETSPMFMICGSLGLFLPALIAALLSKVIRNVATSLFLTILVTCNPSALPEARDDGSAV